MKKIIFLELNEVPLRVMQYYCDSHPRSPFAEFMRKSKVINTMSPDIEHLHPWSTWPTVHRGVDVSVHGLTNLGQSLSDVDNLYPPIWKILVDNGISVGMAGSLHSWPMPSELSNYRFYLPDTFAGDEQAFPDELKAFQAFNLAMVDKSARNVDSGIAMAQAKSMLKNIHKFGFSLNTAASITRQLVDERFLPSRKGRRRIIQSMLTFDIFMKQLESTKPDFTTFFTNHVASTMHRYWLATFPEDFTDHEFTDEWVNIYKGEIDFSMDVASNFISRLTHFVARNPDYSIIIATSMGQAAFQSNRVNRQVFIDDERLFMQAFGIDSHEYVRKRVMAPRFAVTVDKTKLDNFRKMIRGMKVAGQSVYTEEREGGYCMLRFGQENLSKADESVQIGGTTYSFEQVGISNTAIEDQAGDTGYHVPSGVLLLFDPKSSSACAADNETSISTREIAPNILANFGIPVPGYMQSDSLAFL